MDACKYCKNWKRLKKKISLHEGSDLFIGICKVEEALTLEDCKACLSYSPYCVKANKQLSKGELNNG